MTKAEAQARLDKLLEPAFQIEERLANPEPRQIKCSECGKTVVCDECGQVALVIVDGKLQHQVAMDIIKSSSHGLGPVARTAKEDRGLGDVNVLEAFFMAVKELAAAEKVRLMVELWSTLDAGGRAALAKRVQGLLPERT